MKYINWNIASKTLVIMCRIAISVCAAHWWIEGNFIQASVATVALIITTMPKFIFQDLHIRTITTLVTVLLLTAHILFGMLGALYETSLIYDKFMHVLGSWAIAGLLLLAVHRFRRHYSIEIPTMLTIAIVLSGTLSAGTLWEIFEFSVDRTGYFNAQRGLTDTMLDLIADATGACILLAQSLTNRPLILKISSTFLPKLNYSFKADNHE